ncbi:MAG TPA: helix-turn-helix transcriptional regulator [Rudaea sp.]|jgi:DNA-binding XRE family transcriptional regulator
MPNIGAILKDEISRLCRREIRKQVQPVRKVSAGYRHDIAALKRQVQELQRRASALAKRPSQPAAGDAGAEPVRASRFVAKGLRSLRARLGLSASDLARLMGVSDQSVYNWELKKSSPRKAQLAVLATIRALGKREAQARLEALKAPRSRKKKRG